MAKDKADKPEKAKKGKKGAASADAVPAFSLATDPRAAAWISTLKAWGGLGGFLGSLVMALGAGTPLWMACLRAVGFGLALYLVAWALGVIVWRQIVPAELKAVERQLRANAEDAAGSS